ncbi:hypothetical protein E2I00_010200 [Balaenoptera physalus]|uniref:Uncharacterized protein n=1 Tax=Balaenoptera physalus TaxID=9770 RepID=A0A643BW58_BALPH|nr:hypothetical protein E2I00_010200 [Balaenoptera physalus]
MVSEPGYLVQISRLFRVYVSSGCGRGSWSKIHHVTLEYNVPSPERRAFPLLSRKLHRYQASKPDALSRLERGEPWPAEDEIHSRICPEMRKDDCLLQEDLQNQRCPKRMERCREHNALGNIVHRSKSNFPLRQNHMLDFHGKTLKSNLSLVNQNRSYEATTYCMQLYVSVK